MTHYTIPPPQTQPRITLHFGDTLTVNSGGRSHDITIDDGGKEIVNAGGSSLLTTINDGGEEEVTNGSIVDTTINGGQLSVFHTTATNTTLNAFGSFESGRDGSTFTNTVIENGGLLLDPTSTAVNVTFRPTAFPFVDARLGLGNPQHFSGVITGLAVKDSLQFGDGINPIDVTDFHLTNSNTKLTIDYNNGLHMTYSLANMQPDTTFKLEHNEKADVSILKVVPATQSVAASDFVGIIDNAVNDIVGIITHHGLAV
jgi:autotransporter passenger strand-loop-strand repeat protein